MRKKTGAALACVLAASLAIGAVFAAGLTERTAADEAPAPSDPRPAAVPEKPAAYAVDDTTEVLIDAEVSSDEIVKIVKHGDHWHVFTKDGREIITYTDPTKATSASDLTNTAKVVSADELRRVNGNDVVRILKHGDHYHIYTADGREFITYSDPSSLYPHIGIGTYTGSHADHGWHSSSSHAGSDADDDDGGYAPYVPGGNGGGGGSSYEPSAPGLDFVRVVSIRELARKPIVKILKHADHYHAYTADGTEYITYDDPRSAFPNIAIGEYQGSHGGGGQARPEKPAKPAEQDPNDPKRVVRIEKHEDHWHIHHADGTESVTHDDPSALYPNIKIEDYDANHGHTFKPLDENEKFTYDDVEAKLIVPLEYITYGNVTYTTRFDRENQRFVIPHQNHFHYASIETIIQLSKPPFNEFHGYSARDVVATLKYLVLHPEARPKDKEDWGENAGAAPDTPSGETDSGTHGEEPGVQNPGEGEEKPGTQHEKKVVRIVKQSSYWVLYYDDGSTKVVFNDPSAAHPDITVEQFEGGGSQKSDEELIAEYSAMYGMTADEFTHRLFELPAAPLSSMKFNPDGTVVIHGKTYVFKDMGAKAPANDEHVVDDAGGNPAAGAAGLEETSSDSNDEASASDGSSEDIGGADESGERSGTAAAGPRSDASDTMDGEGEKASGSEDHAADATDGSVASGEDAEDR